MWNRKLIVFLLCTLVLTPLYAGGVDKKNLEEYGHGIIKDYSDMKEGGGIEWVWVAPGVHLNSYRFKVAPVENLTAVTDAEMEEVFNTGLPKTLQRVGAKSDDAPQLHVDVAIYWAQRASASKRWIPYAGHHLAQAGAGVEMVFKNDKGDIVAKIRHSGREGEQLKSAAEELVDDITKFVRGDD
jgi:hypothetical protein